MLIVLNFASDLGNKDKMIVIVQLVALVLAWIFIIQNYLATYVHT